MSFINDVGGQHSYDVRIKICYSYIIKISGLDGLVVALVQL